MFSQGPLSTVPSKMVREQAVIVCGEETEAVDEALRDSHFRILLRYRGKREGYLLYIVSKEGVECNVLVTAIGGACVEPALFEFIDMGTRFVCNAGSCGAVKQNTTLGLGEIANIGSVRFREDGVSDHYAKGGEIKPDPAVFRAIALSAEKFGYAWREASNATSPTFWKSNLDNSILQRIIASGAHEIDMETAAVLAICADKGVPAGAVRGVSDSVPWGLAETTGFDFRCASVAATKVALEAVLIYFKNLN